VQPVEQFDQATGLRRLLGEQETFFPAGVFGPDEELNAAATASLAVALARRGSPVCVMDELPGPRNVAGYLGIAADRGLRELSKGAMPLQEAMVRGPADVQLLDAADGVTSAASMSELSWRRLGDEMQQIACEWLLMTARDGDRPSLALACPRRLLVLPAQKNRLPEAYATLKAAHQRQPDGRWWVLVMNAGSEAQVVQLMAALNETTHRFLGIELEYAGAIPKDESIHMAARSLRPLLEMSPSSPAALAFRTLAETMPDWGAAGLVMGPDVFWQRLGLFSRMSAQAELRTNLKSQHGRVYG
jgi:flagellar biosynthesis protein FlhG